MKVLFVCRGSQRDGIGHLTRSRAVAHAVIGAEVRLVAIGDDFIANLLHGSRFRWDVVPTDAYAMAHCRRFDPDVLIFDLLRFDLDHFRDASKQALTVSLSPIFNALTEVDVLFHRTLITGSDWSSGSALPAVRKGLEYAVVPEYCRRIPEGVFRHSLEARSPAIAISMGGTDAANKTLQILNVLARIRQRLLVWVMLGEGYAHSYEDLVHCMHGSRHEVILAQTHDSMWRVLSTCTLAILAGGTTTYEAARAGLPSINTLESPDHYYLIQELVELGVCSCAGKDFADSLANLEDQVSNLLESKGLLLDMHRRSRELIDGRGAERIAQALHTLHEARSTSEVA